MHEICRKDHLARNLRRLSRLFPKDYNFSPKSWIMPTDWAEFNLAHKTKTSQAYIAKPDHGCQGKGIFLFRNPAEIEQYKTNNIIVQSYLSNPLLVDGFKFDLRVYVLVTSVDPFRVFIYRDGLARFATEKYHSPSDKNMPNVRMHLTNYAINKHSEKFVHDENKGSKRSITSLFNYLAETKRVKQDDLWKRIQDVVIKTLLAIQPQLSRGVRPWFPTGTATPADFANFRSSTPQPPPAKPTKLSLDGFGSQCFEILGFDIFLDAKCKPWVIEVNHSPSFSCDSALDSEIKSGLISDTLRLLNMNAVATKKVLKQEKTKIQNRLWKSSEQVNGSMPVRSESRDESLDSEVVAYRNDDTSSVSNSSDANAQFNDEENGDDLRKSSSSRVSTRTISNDTAISRALKADATMLGGLALYQESSGIRASSANVRKTITQGSSCGILLTRENQITSSADASRCVTTSSTKKAQRLVANDKALQVYKERYHQGYLEKLREYEDNNIGKYQRIFPPDDPKKLGSYLYLIEKTASWSSETVSTKARREFLQKKKDMEEEKKRKFEVWKTQRLKIANRVSSKVDNSIDRTLLPRKLSVVSDSSSSLCKPATMNRSITSSPLLTSMYGSNEPMLEPFSNLYKGRKSMSLKVGTISASFQSLPVSKIVTKSKSFVPLVIAEKRLKNDTSSTLRITSIGKK